MEHAGRKRLSVAIEDRLIAVLAEAIRDAPSEEEGIGAALVAVSALMSSLWCVVLARRGVPADKLPAAVYDQIIRGPWLQVAELELARMPGLLARLLRQD